MARVNWLTTGIVAVATLAIGVFAGYQVRLLDTNRARIVPTCQKFPTFVVCKVEYMNKEAPAPRISFEALDSERLLVVATRVDRGRDGILQSHFWIHRSQVEKAGMDFKRMKVYYESGATKELKEARTFPPDSFSGLFWLQDQFEGQ